LRFEIDEDNKVVIFKFVLIRFDRGYRDAVIGLS